MVEKQNVNVSVLVAVGSISTVLLIIVIVGIQAWFEYERGLEAEYKRDNAINYELEHMKLKQLEKLNAYRWRDEQNQIATIPIENAMELVVEERNADKD